MSSARQSHKNLQKYSLANRIDMICDAFEQAWREDEMPRIEDYLQKAPGEEQPALLRELIATELEYRRKRLDLVMVEPYVERFSQFAEVVRSAFLALRVAVPFVLLRYPSRAPRSARLAAHRIALWEKRQ